MIIYISHHAPFLQSEVLQINAYYIRPVSLIKIHKNIFSCKIYGSPE